MELTEIKEFIKGIVENIDLKITNVLDKVTLITDNLDKNVENNKSNITILYDRDKECREERGKLTPRVSALEATDKTETTNKGFMFTVVGLIIAIVVAVIGWVL